MGLWIHKVGIEVEIGVKKADEFGDTIDYDARNFRTTGDGSLRTTKDNVRKVEYVSEAVDYPDGLSRLETGLNDIYEIARDINYSMGLHIHVSLNQEGYYLRLASTKFHDFFIDRLKDSDLWERDAEDSERLRKRVRDEDPHPAYSSRTYGHYAQEIEDGNEIDQQLNRGSNKYRRIRFHPNGGAKTVEFRLFPAMNEPEHVMEAIDVVTTSINHYLRQAEFKDDFKAEARKMDEDALTAEIQDQVETGEMLEVVDSVDNGGAVKDV